MPASKESSLSSSQQESLPGIIRKIIYTPEDQKQIVKSHHELANTYKIINPYFLFSNQTTPPIIETHLSECMILKIGPITSFSSEEIGPTINEQTINYVFGKAMGTKFPTKDLKISQKLLSIMIGGFEPNRLVVLFKKITESGFNPIASVQAHIGTKDIPISKSSHPNQPSSLSTFQAMKLPQSSEASLHFYKKYGDTLEHHITCLSRLFVQDKSTFQSLKLDKDSLAWQSMAALAFGVEQLYPQAKIAIYDTHTPHIQSKLSNMFAMNLISEPGEIIITPEVMNTVLAHHYGDSLHWGGYINNIVVGYVDLKYPPTYYNQANKSFSKLFDILENNHE